MSMEDDDLPRSSADVTSDRRFEGQDDAELGSYTMGCRLLLNASDGEDWRLWARALPFVLPSLDDEFRAATRLPTDAAAIEPALAGFGVALADVHRIRQTLRDGALAPATTIGPMKRGAHRIVRHAPQKPAVRTCVECAREVASGSEVDTALDRAGTEATPQPWPWSRRGEGGP